MGRGGLLVFLWRGNWSSARPFCVRVWLLGGCKWLLLELSSEAWPGRLPLGVDLPIKVEDAECGVGIDGCGKSGG